MGLVARVSVGLSLIYLAILWHDPWRDGMVGVIALPGLVTAVLAVRARRSPEPLRATGPIGHAANAVVIVALTQNPATSGAAMIFYGASMLVAAARRGGGCEVTAISNAVLGRDDQVGCPLFWPLDAVEEVVRRTRRERAAA